jgi:DNA-binding response OmpR family regulator
MKILIADDDPISRRLLKKTLQVAGYDVVAVPNGLAAAEQLCKQDGPRLALLDWEMPELDGPAVCREVRKKKDQGYVYMILLTSKGLKTDIVTGLGSGADDYLTKPFDTGELKARLRTGQRILHLEGRPVEARENMRFKATHDALTSLFNRGVIMELWAAKFHVRGVSASPQQFCFVTWITLRILTTLMAISSATKYYRKPPGACSYRCALMITSGDTAVKSS